MKKMIFLKVKNSYNKKLVTWLDLNLQVAHKFIYKFIYTIEKDGDEFLCYVNDIEINRVKNKFVFVNFDRQKEECFKK